MSSDKIELKGSLMRDILAEIGAHEATFQEPCPYRNLNLKFFIRARPLGTLKGVLQELTIDGTLEAERLRTGGILYSIKRSSK